MGRATVRTSGNSDLFLQILSGQAAGLAAAGYTRRSDDDQSTFSPEAQRRIVEQAARGWKLDVVSWFSDDDTSGGQLDRAGFQAMLAAARAKQFAVLIVPKVDRFSRDVIQCLQTIDQLHALGLTVVSVGEPYDFRTPLGRKMLTMAASDAEWYRNNLSLEVKKGLVEKWEQGLPNGPLPLGYARQFDRDGRGERVKGSERVVTTPDLATVRLAGELYLTGNHSGLTIAEELNRRGLTLLTRNGQRVPFTVDTVMGMLGNPFYAGLVVYKGETRPGRHEALWTAEEWARLQAIRQRRRPAAGYTKVRREPALLLEIGFCGHCGGRLNGHPQTRADGTPAYAYRCATRHRFGRDGCAAPMVNAEAAEAEVLALLHGLALPDEVVGGVVEALQLRAAPQPQQLPAEQARIREQIRRLRTAYLAGDSELSDSLYFSRLAQLESQLRPAPTSTPQMVDVTAALRWLADLPALIQAAAPRERRTLVHQIIGAVWLTGTRGKATIAGWREQPVYTVLLTAAAKVEKATPSGLGLGFATLPPRWSDFRIAV